MKKEIVLAGCSVAGKPCLFISFYSVELREAFYFFVLKCLNDAKDEDESIIEAETMKEFIEHLEGTKQ